MSHPSCRDTRSAAVATTKQNGGGALGRGSEKIPPAVGRIAPAISPPIPLSGQRECRYVETLCGGQFRG